MFVLSSTASIKGGGGGADRASVVDTPDKCKLHLALLTLPPGGGIKGGRFQVIQEPPTLGAHQIVCK